MGKLWLFDFDGTLVDSEKAIKACYLKVGQELIPERCDFINSMVIGPTLHESSIMILTKKNLHLLDEFKKRFQQLYDDKLVLETLQYPCVDDTLKQLYAKGDHLCIVTNKRSYPTHKLIKYFKWNNLFKWIACMDEYPFAKNKTELLNIIKIKRSPYTDIFFVGDTLSDGIASNKYNYKFIKAEYGYGLNESWDKIRIHYKINNFSDLLNIN